MQSWACHPLIAKARNLFRRHWRRALQVREWADVVWVYFGDDAAPPLPRYLPLVSDQGQRSLEATRLYDYNWLNFIENDGIQSCFFQYVCYSFQNPGSGNALICDDANILTR